ncbi:MAG: hypothetical protein M5U28_19500 [Sandaracinaceae bacterium]|nr:hypothetical protein [Sandaracinaceae bacterium]
MQRKAMIGGAALLIALALGLGVWVSQSGRAAPGAPAHEGEGDAVAGGGGIAGASPREAGERPAPRRFEADGGIARLPAPPRGLPVPPGLPGGRTRGVASLGPARARGAGRHA